MRFRLRTLLIVLALGLVVLAFAISLALVVFQQPKVVATQSTDFWPGTMLRSDDGTAYIHISSNGRRESGVPGLVGCLEHENPGIRASAALWLGAIGPKASDALPALRKASNDPHAKVRATAAEAVRLIEAGPMLSKHRAESSRERAPSYPVMRPVH